MRIGDLSRRAGVSVRALRYYEEQGLLSSTRTPGGQRQYSEDAVDRVLFFQQMYSAGLNSSRIADVLPCMDTGTTDERQRAMLAEDRKRLDARIADLTRARDLLDGVISTANERAGITD
ncbi:MerR family transcriptional regulator [Nesterenkonia sp. E16_7]|nr:MULTISPECIES: MerR family transcriptional regulator [unclassified Nesterenkonia]MBO0594889.1 MerR family transcriptional regulator [Nesterenkonia sp. E16_10]MBO0599825.1 MerR family transcriptional regulator [Nesterenkonia sp. E16_7]